MQFIPHNVLSFCLAALSTHCFKWREHHVSWITKPVVGYFSFTLALIVPNLFVAEFLFFIFLF
jgi:hypothetical protein